MGCDAYISLGSNVDGDAHLAAARHALSAAFGDITYSPVMHTAPIGMTNPALFSNQVARFTTSLSAPTLRKQLKQIELQVVVVPKQKATEQIYIDIDLLKLGDTIIKPTDWERDFVKEAVSQL